MTNLKGFFVYPSATIQEAMVTIDRNAKGIALVVDEQHHLLGTVTDGDIRRAILTGLSLNTAVTECLSRKTDTAYPKPITALQNTDKATLLQMMQTHTVRQIPLLDQEGQVVDLATADELLPQGLSPMQAVVMAGGFGTRLHPLTESLPKPMLPVGDRPLLELIIERLKSAGIHHVNIATHYMPEKIIDHFGDGQKFGVNLTYVSEDVPLGTAGALGLMEAPEEPLLVINGDILTQVDFRAMLAFHHEQEADLTVAVRAYDLQVPYGVLECDGPYVRQLREKPTYNFFVNAGIYLLQPSVHRYIPNGQHFDMTDLIEALIALGRPVVSFPVVEYWLDIGQHIDYQQAQEDVEGGRLI